MQQAVDCHDARDQTSPLSLFGAHLATGQAHLHRLGFAYGSGQTLGTANAGEHTEGDFRQAKARIVGRVDEVAHQGKFTTTAEGVTGHGCDQGFASGGDAVSSREEVVQEYLRKSELGHLLDIGAGGKSLGRTGDDHAANGGVFFQLVQRQVQLSDDLRVDGIE
ncbi:hypothetical protein D3C72_1714310 [compost metagenome]